MALLLASCRAHPSPVDLTEIRTRTGEVRDWPRLLGFARRHGVAPLLAETLRMAGIEREPETVALRESRLRNAKRALALAVEQGQLLDALLQAGVVAVPYKGLALAESLYGSLDRRGAGDMDFLIHPDTLPVAASVLAARSYHLYSEPRGGDIYDRAFVRDSDKVAVELHWLLKSACAGMPRPVTEFWPLLIPTRVGGREVLGFPPELLLVLLTEHGTRHAWERLKWLCDVAELLRATPQLDWSQVEALTRPDARRALALTMLLANAALDAPLPPGCSPKLFTPEVMRIAQKMAYAWSLETTPERNAWSQWVYSMLLTEGIVPQARATWGQIVAVSWPSAADREWVTLPRWLNWGYPVVRAIRAATQSVRARRSKKDQPPP